MLLHEINNLGVIIGHTYVSLNFEEKYKKLPDNEYKNKHMLVMRTVR